MSVFIRNVKPEDLKVDIQSDSVSAVARSHPPARADAPLCPD